MHVLYLIGHNAGLHKPASMLMNKMDTVLWVGWQNKGTVLGYTLSCRELNEEIDTTFKTVQKVSWSQEPAELSLA